MCCLLRTTATKRSTDGRENRAVAVPQRCPGAIHNNRLLLLSLGIPTFLSEDSNLPLI
jgi:hypothetical protein